MIRIIDLDINGSLTGDTRVEEIAMVEMPAIEQDFIYFGKEDFFKAPNYIAENACRARKYKEDNGSSCGTNIGWTRSAQLCNGDELSLDTIKRMYSYLSRHKVDLESSTDYETGCGLLMYDAWGGKEALTWTEKILEREEDMAEVGERGGIKESDKAPKSGTKNTNPKGEGSAKGDASTTRGAEVSKSVEEILQNKSDDFNERYKDKLGYGVNLGMLKSVYQRGVGAYNTSHSPAVKSSQQWALARVNAFLYIVKNGRPENSKYTTDYDLLPTEHPKKNKGEENMEYEPSLPDYVGYATGDTKNDMLIEEVLFVEKIEGESKKDYLQRCIAHHIKVENHSAEQSYAICISQYENDEYAKGQNVSFDYDDTLTTNVGQGLAKSEIASGSNVFIISARPEKSRMLGLAEELGIPEKNIYATGSNKNKILKIKQLGILRHYDNNPDVLKEIGRVGKRLKYNNQFSGIDEYDEDELEIVNNLQFLKETDFESFEAVVGEMARGSSLSEIKRLNHQKPTPYYIYKRVDSGSPDRDFCMSIEGRYFRRIQIDALRDYNTEFGHEKQPYSKWLYKGGPNCVHAWIRVIALGKNVTEVGREPGLPGTPPKQMKNNGYYSEETKRASEVAYIISQQNSKQIFKADNEKRIIYSPLMIPNMLIPRLDEATNERYYVRFSPNVIEKIQNLYMIEKRQDNTNYEHTNEKMKDVVMVESWLVSGEKDKAFELGFKRDDIPNGTWMGGFKVLDTPEGDYIWNNFIKTGKVKGFSVEGNFIMNFSREKNDEYLLQEIINIIKQITD